MTKKLLVVGSNSVHTRRFINWLLSHTNYELVLITNSPLLEFQTIKQYTVNFALANIKAKTRIRKILEEAKPEIVHIHQANSYAWHSLRAISQLYYHPRVILTAWGSDVLVVPKSMFLSHMVRYCLKHADIITADSLAMSCAIHGLLDGVNRPIHMINFGVQDLPPKQLLSRKKNIILSNRLHKPLYQVDKIIRAFAQLVKRGLIAHDYQLVITGHGEESGNLKLLAARLEISNRVIFTGMLPYAELAAYYKVAKIFVSIPQSDGTPSSLLEAMAYGLIPVLSNLPANLAWVINECNGYIAAYIDELAAQILAAIKHSQDQDSYQKLYDFNYELITKKASLATNMQKFIGLYE